MSETNTRRSARDLERPRRLRHRHPRLRIEDDLVAVELRAIAGVTGVDLPGDEDTDPLQTWTDGGAS